MCVCVRERESRDTRSVDTENTQANVFDKGERLNYFTRWEEGALYSHPLSSLTTKAHESWGMWKLVSYVS